MNGNYFQREKQPEEFVFISVILSGFFSRNRLAQKTERCKRNNLCCFCCMIQMLFTETEFVSTTSMWNHLPVIPVSRLRVIQSPADFYAVLLRLCRSATSSIHLSSLYLGHAENELVSLLSEKLSSSPALKVSFLLDYHRALRLSNDSKSSLTLLSPILSTFPDRVRLHLYKTPHAIADLCPPKYNEIWGTMHMKSYVADDAVLLSGLHYFDNTASDSRNSDPIYLTPTLQLLPLKITQDHDFLYSTLLSTSLPIRKIVLISPYLNFPAKFIAKIFTLLKSSPDELNVDVITGSPKSNGFFNGSGVLKKIVGVYSFLELNLLSRFRGLNGFVLKEYFSNGMTFHVKGLFVWIQGKKKDRDVLVGCIGSSNFSKRSETRDLECQVYFWTRKGSETYKNIQEVFLSERFLAFELANLTSSQNLDFIGSSSKSVTADEVRSRKIGTLERVVARFLSDLF
ncbi:CDP-diacylglycerol--glycerol-3-phosphate 3-phosphatidyltransferase [Nowakowskiella sp. JEL0407]|nr:CDP-diacylglycerol--glycerol-3-phosphate 3-phosphatidyltransferase [Nowakowskiella sp. JEL0407]